MLDQGTYDRCFLVEYCDPGGHWDTIYESLKKKIPLKSVRWSLRDGIRDIESDVELAFKPFDHAAMLKDNRLANMHSKAFLHIFISYGTEDQYKSELRQKISEWIDMVSDLEWMIIHITNREPKLFQGSGLFKTIRNEFNTKNYDRVIAFRNYDLKLKELSVEDLTSRLQEFVVRRVKHVIDDYICHIRTMDSQRLESSWSYWEFFALKEGLAFMYETIKLYDEALIQYDELELLLQLTDKKKISFVSYGGQDQGDDSASALDFRKKDYRDLILKGEITEFDFRLYLFARQAHILFCLSKTITVIRRGVQFVNNIVHDLRSRNFSNEFCAIWSFSVYVDIAESSKANAWRNPLCNTDEQDLQFFLGDLYFNALENLDELGRLHGLVPLDNTHIVCRDSWEPIFKKDTVKVAESHQSLSVALSSSEDYDKLYKSISAKAKLCYRDCGRERSNTRLRNAMANLFMSRGNYKDALASYNLVKNHYSVDGWHHLMFFVLNRIAECQKKLGMKAEYKGSLVELFIPNVLPFSTPDMHALWMNEILTSTDTKESVQINDVNVFRIHLSFPHGKSYNLDKKIVGHIKIKSPFPKDVEVSNIIIRYANRSKKKTARNMVFHVSNSSIVLKQGKNLFDIESDGVRGRFRLDSLLVTIGNMTIQQSLSYFGNTTTALTINPSKSTTEIELSRPESLFLDVRQALKVEISTNNDSIRNTELRIGIPDNYVKVLEDSLTASMSPSSTIHESPSSTANPIALSMVDGLIKIPNLERNQVLQFGLPILAGVEDQTNLKQEVSFELTFTKTTNEKKNITKIFELIFIHPFAYSHRIFESSGRHFVHVSVISNCEIPLVLLSYTLNNSQSIEIVRDFNKESSQESAILRQGDEFIYLFEIKPAKWDKDSIDVELEFEVEFTYNNVNQSKSPESRKNKIMRNTYAIVDTISKTFYCVKYTHQEACEKTIPTAVNFTIDIINMSRYQSLLKTPKVGIFYTVDYEKDSWIIVGKQYGRLDKKKEEKGENNKDSKGENELNSQIEKDISNSQIEKDVSNNQIEKDISNSQIEKDISNSQIEKDIPNHPILNHSSSDSLLNHSSSDSLLNHTSSDIPVLNGVLPTTLNHGTIPSSQYPPSSYSFMLTVIPLKAGYLSVPRVKIVEYSNVEDEKTKEVVDSKYMKHEYIHEHMVSYPERITSKQCKQLQKHVNK